MITLVIALCAVIACTAWGAPLEDDYLPPSTEEDAGLVMLYAAPEMMYGSPPDDYENIPVGFGGYSGGISGSPPSVNMEYGVPRQANRQIIPIVSYSNIPNNGDGSYSYRYETGNSINAQESGHAGPDDDQGTQAEGDFAYMGDNGERYSVSYTADENGFKAQGAHLPMPPPIPKEILDSLALQGFSVNPDGSYSDGNQKGNNDYPSSGTNRGFSSGYRYKRGKPKHGKRKYRYY